MGGAHNQFQSDDDLNQLRNIAQKSVHLDCEHLIRVGTLHLGFFYLLMVSSSEHWRTSRELDHNLTSGSSLGAHRSGVI